MTTPETSRKKIIGPFEWLALIAAVLIIAYVILQKGGVKVLERSEDVEFIDPSKSHQPEFTPPSDTKTSETDKNVDQMLEEMARDFTQNNNTDDPGTKSKWGLSEEESDFYNDIRKRYQLDDKIKSTTDWLKILKTSQQTYSRVKDLFSTKNPSPDASHLLDDSGQTDDFYQQLHQVFNIATDDIEAFARSGKKTLQDWVAFVAEQQAKTE